MTQYTHKHKYVGIIHTHKHTLTPKASQNLLILSDFILPTSFLNPHSFLSFLFPLDINLLLLVHSLLSYCFGFEPQEKNKSGKIFPSWTKS